MDFDTGPLPAHVYALKEPKCAEQEHKPIAQPIGSKKGNKIILFLFDF
jgi:hypothetical protein